MDRCSRDYTHHYLTSEFRLDLSIERPSQVVQVLAPAVDLTVA